MLINCAVYAQNSQSNQKSQIENIFFETVTFPSNDSPDSNEVYFFVKIRLTELIFDKSDYIKPNSFSAYPLINIEIKDNTGIIRKRIFRKDTITIDDYSILKETDKYYEGMFNIRLSSSDYVIHYLVTVNNRDIYDKRINLKTSKKNQLTTIGNPVLVNLLPREDSNYVPVAFSNRVDIKSSNPSLLVFVNPTDKRLITSSITYIMESKVPPKDYLLTAIAEVKYLDNMGIDFRYNGKNYSGTLIKNNNSSIYQIPIPQEMIYPGKFVISMIDRMKKDTLRYNYEVVWIDKPKSALNQTYAQEIMYYILNDAEFAELKSTKDKEKEAYINNYWKKFDPTPKTFYNEAMNAYFKRADEAKIRFSTILHSDGAKTQRGQVYILNGNPDSIENELKVQKPIERWHYKKLKKQFIFEITTPGEYKLVQVIE